MANIVDLLEEERERNRRDTEDLRMTIGSIISCLVLVMVVFGFYGFFAGVGILAACALWLTTTSRLLIRMEQLQKLLEKK